MLAAKFGGQLLPCDPQEGEEEGKEEEEEEPEQKPRR